MTGNDLRMVLVYDRQTNSATIPTFDTIFGRTDDAGTEASGVLDNLRYDNTGRFTVLMDKVITSNPGTSGGAAAADICKNVFYCDEYIKLRNLETFYSSTTNPGANTDISSGSLYLFWRATTNGATTSQWAVTSNSIARLRYYD